MTRKLNKFRDAAATSEPAGDASDGTVHCHGCSLTTTTTNLVYCIPSF